MVLLIVGMLIFISAHALPELGFEGRIKASQGEGAYKGLVAILSVVGLVLIGYGYSNALYTELWYAGEWVRDFSLGAVLVAMILVVAAYAPPSNLRRLTANPMLWGVTIWGIVHLIANGDLASLILFGGFAGFALWKMHSLTERGKAVPTRGRQPIWRDALALAGGTLLFAVLLSLHGWLFGVNPLWVTT